LKTKIYKSIILPALKLDYIKGQMQGKGIWNHDPEANICLQKKMEWGVEKAPKVGTSNFVHFS
jgi:hypothetical protein